MDLTVDRFETHEEMRRRLGNPGLFNLVCSLQRHGVSKFLTVLEWECFSPKDPQRNDLFQIGAMEWESLKWWIVSFPKEYRKAAERIAKNNGLRFADGVPTSFGPEGPISFPLNTPNTFTIEYESGNEWYSKNLDRKAHKEAFDKEHEECVAIRRANGVTDEQEEEEWKDFPRL